MEPADDDILVVAGIADQRDSLGVPREIFNAVDVEREQHAPGVVLVVLEGLVYWARAVEAVKVVTRRPEVDQGIRVVLDLETRCGVERDVVIHELAEVCIRRRDVGIVARWVGSTWLVPTASSILLPHRVSQLLQLIDRILRSWRQLSEHPPEPTFK